MRTRTIAAASFCLIMAFLSVGIPAVVAESTTKYSVVVSRAPNEPQRSTTWVAASSASGEWRGGGSGVLVGGLAKAFPPFPYPSDIQAILDFKVVDGGPTGTANFFLEAEVTVSVDHVPSGFPIPPLEWIKRARLTFPFLEGRNIQDVELELYLDPPGPGAFWTSLGPRRLMTVITQIG